MIDIASNHTFGMCKQEIPPTVYTPKLGCSKLTMSLVNISLKFQTLPSQICQYFFVEKIQEAFAMQMLLSFFQLNNFNVFGYKVIKYLMSWPLNELVELTMLWTTRPSSLVLSLLLAWSIHKSWESLVIIGDLSVLVVVQTDSSICIYCMHNCSSIDPFGKGFILLSVFPFT